MFRFAVQNMVMFGVTKVADKARVISQNKD